MQASLGLTAAILALVLSTIGCSEKFAAKNDASSSAVASNLPYIQASVSVSILDGQNIVYSDSVPSSSLKLTAGRSYKFHLETENAPPSVAYQLTMTNIGTINQNPTTLPLTEGDNSFTVPSAGNYAWKLELKATGYNTQSKSYTAEVLCPNPNFSAASLNAGGIQVASGSGSNLYNLSSAGVISTANGSPPYQCAWDLTGVGIVDTGFKNCSQTLNNAYINYVSLRQIGLVVRDACNKAFTVTNPRNLNYEVPLSPGDVFIYGQTSAATGLAASDARTNAVTYLATNSGGHNIVIPSYGGGSFTIEAMQNYGQPSSVKFGVKISIQGIKDTINNASNSNPTIDVSAAKIKQIIYSTDQAGDQAAAMTFTSTNCSLSNLHARAVFVAGQPCSAGTTGNNNKTTVEVWGHYSCNMSAPNGSTMKFQGDFDGFDDIADSCSGGGGGGGGIVPINL